MGISNVYRGRYERIDGSSVEGTGIADLVTAIDSALNADMLSLLELADTQVNNIFVPFDRAIVNPESRPQVFDTVFTLQDLGDKTVELASSMGLVIDTALPA